MLLPLICLCALTSCDKLSARFAGAKTAFNGDTAMSYLKTQVAFGPRVPGTPGHRRTGDWIIAEMKKRADTVIVQSWDQKTPEGNTLPLRNILARFKPAARERVLYLTHWDTRPHADSDPNLGNRQLPIPGANDGASGPALFIALADVFKKTPPSVGVDLLFVDGEDWGEFDADSNGAYPDALFGSQYFATHLPSPDYKPLYAVLFDMIGDADLQMWQEGYSVESAPEVVTRVWSTAADLGYSRYFLSQPQGTITDDHVPLQKVGIHAIDVIDIQYGTLPKNYGPSDTPSPNYHHTMQDTIDKCSAKSLQIVGDVALTLVK
jgi:hypothetical protein